MGVSEHTYWLNILVTGRNEFLYPPNYEYFYETAECHINNTRESVFITARWRQQSYIIGVLDVPMD